MNINQIPDKVLADILREGCYSRNTNFTPETRLLVFAIPYDERDETPTMRDAFEAFRELLVADDWYERNIQVLTVENETPVIRELALENILLAQEEDENQSSYYRTRQNRLWPGLC